MDVATLKFDDESLGKAIALLDPSSVERQTCEEYSLCFGRQIDTANDLGDPLRFLAIVCGWRLRPDDPQDPFDCSWCAFSWQSLTELQIHALSSVAPGVADAELRARLCDIVWMVERSHTHAKVAAEAYVASAERLIRARAVIGEKERLTRAIQMATLLGPGGSLVGETVRRVEAIAEWADLLHCTLAVCLEVLLNSKEANSSRLHTIAVERAASIAQREPNPLWERKFWELAAGFAAQNKDDNAKRSAMMSVALTFEQEAQNAPMQATAAHFWGLALRTYRRNPGAKADCDRVHRELLKAQQQIPKEMFPVADVPIDITELVSTAQKRCRNKDKWHGLAELVLATRWHTKTYVREQAEKTIHSFPIQHMWSSVRFGSTWKVAGKAAGVDPTASDISAERLLAEMCQQYRYFIAIVANGTIEPMRREVLNAHSVTLEDIAELVRNCPVIPDGRDAFFTIGIHAGLHGRFIESLHVLIPQLEHLLRWNLNANHVVTSSYNEAGIQQEFDLNRLLNMAEVESLLGEDLCFVLRVVLTERYGYNLRNEIAHGMLTPGFFFSEAAVYAWWLTLRIVAGSLANAILTQGEKPEDDVSQ